jgi:hypothetical protein
LRISLYLDGFGCQSIDCEHRFVHGYAVIQNIIAKLLLRISLCLDGFECQGIDCKHRFVNGYILLFKTSFVAKQSTVWMFLFFFLELCLPFLAFSFTVCYLAFPNVDKCGSVLHISRAGHLRYK